MYFNVPSPNKLFILVNTTLTGVLFAVMKIRLNLLFCQCVQQNQDDDKGKKYSCFNYMCVYKITYTIIQSAFFVNAVSSGLLGFLF